MHAKNVALERIVRRATRYVPELNVPAKYTDIRYAGPLQERRLWQRLTPNADAAVAEAACEADVSEAQQR